MRFMRIVGVLWLLGALAHVAMTAHGLGLLDPRVFERRIDPLKLLPLTSSVAIIVPALVLIAVTYMSPRQRRPRIFSHSRHAHHVKHNEKELARARRAKRPMEPEPQTPARERLIDLPPNLKQARADAANPPATVATEKPAPRRRSVIER